MKKKLLIFTEYFSPAQKGGGPVSSIKNLINVLYDYYDIGVVCFNHDLNSVEPFNSVKTNDWNNWENKTNVFYISKQNFSFSFSTKIIVNFNPDIIYLNAIFVFKFNIPAIKYANNRNVKLVIATRGMVQVGALKNKPFLKKTYFLFLKLFLDTNKTIWHATDDTERRDIIKTFGNSNIVVLQNVVEKPRLVSVENVGKEIRLVYLSLISEKKNLLFLLRLLKDVKIDLSLDIYGPIKDVEYWESSKSMLLNNPKNIKVEYKGEVETSNVGDVLSKYSMLVLPTLGENFGHIIFESFANGVPVLVSDKTPWRGLELENIGYDVELITGKWIDVIENLDSNKLLGMRETSLKFADKYYENKNYKEEYINLFEN